MARLREEALKYFPHDTDASFDEKLQALRLTYGNNGYAFYFILLERIYRNPNFELDVSSEKKIKLLAAILGIEVKLFKEMLETAFEYNIFDKKLYESKKVLSSSGIKRRAEFIVNDRERKRQQYKRKKDGEITEK